MNFIYLCISNQKLYKFYYFLQDLPIKSYSSFKKVFPMYRNVKIFFIFSITFLLIKARYPNSLALQSYLNSILRPEGGGLAHIGNLIRAVLNSLSNGTFRFALSPSFTKILELYKSFSNVSQCKKVFSFAYNSLNKHIFLSLNKSLVTLKTCFLKKYIFIFFEKSYTFPSLKFSVGPSYQKLFKF